ncbi:unnamed protein product [Zymoseptoria tritici ST99CH_3D1]|nr:unnamed protein product [Zymoseptoria tritici ST99CH_3D1]
MRFFAVTLWLSAVIVPLATADLYDCFNLPVCHCCYPPGSAAGGYIKPHGFCHNKKGGGKQCVPDTAGWDPTRGGCRGLCQG